VKIGGIFMESKLYESGDCKQEEKYTKVPSMVMNEFDACSCLKNRVYEETHSNLICHEKMTCSENELQRKLLAQILYKLAKKYGFAFTTDMDKVLSELLESCSINEQQYKEIYEICSIRVI
jgi:hypothetical protein